jgi:small subunit ribosomal protein S15
MIRLGFANSINHFSSPISRSIVMPLLQQRKQEIFAEYQVHETDTGSADVQVAMLTARINQLSAHLKSNSKDHSSRRGLLKMIGRRKRLLSYIIKSNPDHYRSLITRLGIRG